jgi:hypothetical protein
MFEGTSLVVNAYIINTISVCVVFIARVWAVR